MTTKQINCMQLALNGKALVFHGPEVVIGKYIIFDYLAKTCNMPLAVWDQSLESVFEGKLIDL